MTDIRDDAEYDFAALYGRAPDGVWSAPGLVNLIGDLTGEDGLALSLAINGRTIVALGIADTDVMRVASSEADELAVIPLDELSPANLGDWAAYPLGVAWALGQARDRGGGGVDLRGLPGVNLWIDSTVPIGAGLASSAAMLCAVGLALDDAWRLGLDRRELARVVHLAENEAVGVTTGIVDHTAGLRGWPDHAVLVDSRELASEQVELGFADDRIAVLFIDTGAVRDRDRERERRDQCERATAALGLESLRDLTSGELDRARASLDESSFRRVRHVVTENERVVAAVRALRERDPRRLGALLDASHASLRDDYGVSIPELDLAVETARGAGALGARMTGGGSAIALVPADLVPHIQVAIDGACAEHGFAQPIVSRIVASEGAKRDR